jgi:hypothetical protein
VLDFNPRIISLHLCCEGFAITLLNVFSVLEKSAHRTVSYKLERLVAEPGEKLLFDQLVLVSSFA